MITLKISNKDYPCEILDYGVDGYVYTILGDPFKVIKIGSSLQKTYTSTRSSVFNTLDYLKNNNIENYAKVFDYGMIDNNKYYYIMEKLFLLSEDERKVFHTILSHEDRNLIKSFNSEKLNDILLNLSHGLDFDIERIIFFYESTIGSPIYQKDSHERNIMKNLNGDFKWIDFERCYLKTKLENSI